MIRLGNEVSLTSGMFCTKHVTIFTFCNNHPIDQIGGGSILRPNGEKGGRDRAEDAIKTGIILQEDLWIGA